MKNRDKSQHSLEINVLRGSGEGRFLHRLHCIILVKNGLRCSQVAEFFGDSTRAVQTWVRRYEEKGMDGIREISRNGRPARLTEKHLEDILVMINASQQKFGPSNKGWNGKSLSSFIQENYGIRLGPRQCQRYLKRLASESEIDLSE